MQRKVGKWARKVPGPHENAEQRVVGDGGTVPGHTFTPQRNVNPVIIHINK